MNKKSIYVTMRIEETAYTLHLIQVPNIPRIILTLILDYYKKIMKRVVFILKSRYSLSEDVHVKIQTQYIDRTINNNFFSEEISQFLNNLVLTKILRYFVSDHLIISKKHFSSFNIRKHLLRDLKYWNNLGYENVLVVGKYSHEFLDDAEKFNWIAMSDKMRLNQEILSKRNRLIGMDYVAVLEDGLINDFDRIVSKADKIHICEIRGFKKFRPTHIH
jgi:hypothetical protein